MIERKSKREIEMMREGGQILAGILRKVADAVEIGVSTAELDQIARDECAKESVQPAFLGYRGFPGALCTSINEEVVHGIPSKSRKLTKGDILKVDCGVLHKGYYADAAVTIPVGELDGDTEQLIRVGQESLAAAIDAARPGNTVGDIGAAVESVATRYNYGIVRDFVGHGIGRALHEDPQVPNYGTSGSGAKLKEGMVLAIEPMLNIGGDAVSVAKDGWTVVTDDASRSVHVEHTIAILADGPEILTIGTPLYAEGVRQ